VHFGLNGYAISLKKWNELSGQEQTRLQSAFDAYQDDLWRFSRETHKDASDCNIGHTCKFGVPTHMTLVNPSKADMEKLRDIMRTQLIPEWSAKCEKVHPGCRQDWMEKVFALTQ
jgi:TRAP-type C4-dicarboxylate transport system substrate-binding protein